MENSANIIVKIILSLSAIQDSKELFEKGLISESEFNEKVLLHDAKFNELNSELLNSKTEFANRLKNGILCPFNPNR